MANAAFITTKYIKDNSPVLGYVSDDELVTFIQPAQDMNLERVLGTKLYKRLKDGLINSNLNADEIFLIKEYIQPALMYWVIYQYILWANYKFTNKSVSKQSSDNSVPSEQYEVNYLKSNISDWAEYYSQRITDYLRDNFNKHPQYFEGVSGYEDKFPTSRNYLFGGMYIPQNRIVDHPEKTRWDSWTLNW
jgi:hypothetical protein